MHELIMYVGVFGLSSCKGLLSKYNWLNYLLIVLYLLAQYLTALRRGRIAPPCMRQAIAVCVGLGLYLIYYSSGTAEEVNIYIHELFLIAISFITLYVYVKADQKTPKPSTDYLLTKYKKICIPINAPDECIICRDLMTFSTVVLQCKRCKHSFHKKCLRKWCDESATCPFCRYEYR